MNRPKLTGPQIWLLLHIEKLCGLTGRTTLRQKHREIAVPLWRRELLAIWWRSMADDRPRGPYFCLTAAGYQLACALLAAREERLRKRQSCLQPRPQALAA